MAIEKSLYQAPVGIEEAPAEESFHYVIKQKFNIDEDYIKMFFHYEPSTYHLHIHFVNVAHHDARSSVEYSHELNNVIFNLLICSDYYNIAVLNKRT